MIQKIPNYEEKCPMCGKSGRVSDLGTGEIVCGKCGFVIFEKIEETGPERSSFSEDGISKSRTGMRSSLSEHDMGLSTVIDRSNKDATGKNISAPMKIAMGRIRIWDARSQSQPIDRNMKDAFSYLKKMKDKLSLSDAVTEKAAYIYRKAMELRLGRGRTIIATVAASLYIACRDAETPRTLRDVADVANIKKGDIAVAYRKLVTELGLKMPVTDSVNCISRIASSVGISEKAKRTAIKIIKEAETRRISEGKNPVSVAATALYIASVKNGEKFTQKEVAQAANITEVTIRNRMKELTELGELF